MKTLQLTETISLFLIETELNFQQTIELIEKLGFNALEGKEHIERICQMQKNISLPTDKRYIIGLSDKRSLEFKKFQCGTILYYYPILYQTQSENGIEYHQGMACMSATGVVDNFKNNYIIGIKRPLGHERPFYYLPYIDKSIISAYYHKKLSTKL